MSALSGASKLQSPKALPLRDFDPIVFANELIKHGIVPQASKATAEQRNASIFKAMSRSGVAQPIAVGPPAASAIKEGTFKGTQKAMSAAYEGILGSLFTYFDIHGAESSIPRGLTSLDRARKDYTWSIPSPEDDYPPHLAIIPEHDQVSLLTIFNKLRLFETKAILSQIIPISIVDYLNGDPSSGETMQAIVDRNKELRYSHTGVNNQPNIGDQPDWYTDNFFARQQLSGTNPVTIELASKTWLDAFIAEATKQKNQPVLDILQGKAPDSNPNDSLYVQDYSWFRKATGLTPTQLFESSDKVRHTGAPVALFRLTAKDGKLHPLAICIDFKESFDKSVVKFNNRVRASDDTSKEGSDWPWRYAKTAFQSADWHLHEIGVHLTESHFVEEATIVAANRSFPETHIVYQLLSPHWFRTFSLNAGARTVLMPSVIVPLAGMEVFKFARYIYKNYDFKAHYVPNDLKRRGFPESELNSHKFHNAAYARNVSIYWNILHEFVNSILLDNYKSDDPDPKVALAAADAAITKDECVQNWSKEMRDSDKGDLASFPIIQNLEDLVDAITACIHIASPLHSAVNYLQNYYYAFVIAKPPSLFTPLPSTLADLNQIHETDLLNALPVNRPRDWLIASHVPWLLSSQVADKYNILTWAATVANTAARNPKEETITTAARTLWKNLMDLSGPKGLVQQISDAMDDHNPEYLVFSPEQVAVSILI